MVLSSWRLPSLSRVPASPVPRCRRYYEGATTSCLCVPAPLFVSVAGPTRPPLFVFAVALSPVGWEQAVESGSEWAMIVRWTAATPCGQSWGQATPLIAVRASVVLDKSLLPVRLGGDGAPRLGDAR